ncbi:4-hydroxy-3-methylbut-2-enyl diphosphate reductase [Candidatus Parcubacteria bacterium]|jgi:4-hydroxy-3-methylbut-2-enyl diphosphate reductase|nr:MAG: 4-hydroxy-3-methylbut-2-enyl diphosphate reductase [Candidatus Parcubacteria bacterium]
MKIILAKPRGFCAGVDRAIDTVELALELFGKPVYVKHQIVHNTHVVAALEAKGAIFVESVLEIPKKSVLVFSAHGVPPEAWQQARARELEVIDATCPLVTRVHFEAKNFSRKGYDILLIGHRGHVEVVGTMGEAPGKIQLVNDVNEAKKIQVNNPDKLVVLSQTTLSLDDTAEILEVLKSRFPKLETPPKGDICYATTNRQAAVKALASRAQVILVVGSKESSNANRLREVAEVAGARSWLINDPGEIKTEWLEGAESIGITSGASTPEDIFETVVATVQRLTKGEVVELEHLREGVWFALPETILKSAKDKNLGGAILKKHEIAKQAKMTVN